MTSVHRVLVTDWFHARRKVPASSSLDEYVFAALRAGASGFVLKDTPPGELLAAIRVIAAGDTLLSPGITRRLISEFASRPEPSSTPSAALAEITDRGREVLTLIGLGMSNDEIAAKLFVSMSTVKAHVGRLLSKLGARDRAQLVIAAYSARFETLGVGAFDGPYGVVVSFVVTRTGDPGQVGYFMGPWV